MRKNVYSNDNEPFVIEGCGLNGINLNAEIEAGAAGTAVTKPGFDLAAINLKLDLVHRGGKVPVFAGLVKPWALASAFLTTMWSCVYPNSANYAVEIKKANATGVKETSVAPCQLLLPHPVVTKDGYRLEGTLQIPSTAVHSSVGTSTSYIMVSEDQAAVNPTHIPQVAVYTIRASENSFNMPLGDNVVGVFLINYDKTDILEASTPWTNVRLETNKIKKEMTYSELLAERIMQFPTKAESDDRDQNFMILPLGEAHDDVRLSMDLSTGDVTANNCHVVVFYATPSASLIDKANRRYAKHKNEFGRNII